MTRDRAIQLDAMLRRALTVLDDEIRGSIGGSESDARRRTPKSGAKIAGIS